MNDEYDDLVDRSLIALEEQTHEGSTERKARFREALIRLESDPTEVARIDAIAAEAGLDNLLDTQIPAAEPVSPPLPAFDPRAIEEIERKQAHVNLMMQNTLQMQDKLIAQAERMQEAMNRLEDLQPPKQPTRGRRNLASQLTIPSILALLIAVSSVLVGRSLAASVVAISFASAVVGYVAMYSTVLAAAARRMMRSDSSSARRAEKALRLLLGSLSVEERIAEVRAYAAAAAMRNAPPGEDLTLQVGPAEDPDVIELSRNRRRASS